MDEEGAVAGPTWGQSKEGQELSSRALWLIQGEFVYVDLAAQKTALQISGSSFVCLKLMSVSEPALLSRAKVRWNLDV